jgi:hypothetical protein
MPGEMNNPAGGKVYFRLIPPFAIELVRVVIAITIKKEENLV